MNNAPLSLVSCVASTAGRRTDDEGEREGNVLSLRSERENDFSETGGRDGRNRRFLIRPPPVAENAVSYRQKRRTDGRRVMGTGPGEEKCYLFAGDNNAAATATWQRPLSSTPLSLSATPKDRRRTHCDSAATNTSRLKIHLGCGRQTMDEKEEGVTFVVI